MDEAVAKALQLPLDPENQAPDQAGLAIVQAPAMRSVEAGDGLSGPRQERAGDTRENAALGAMPVDDVGVEPLDDVEDTPGGQQVGRIDGSRHRQPDDAKREVR